MDDSRPGGHLPVDADALDGYASPVLPTSAKEVIVVPKIVITRRNAPQVRLARK